MYGETSFPIFRDLIHTDSLSTFSTFPNMSVTLTNFFPAVGKLCNRIEKSFHARLLQPYTEQKARDFQRSGEKRMPLTCSIPQLLNYTPNNTF